VDKKTIIKLYDLGILDIDGQVNEAVIEEMGYEDGEAFARLYSVGIPHGAELALVELEYSLKAFYSLADSREFMDLMVEISGEFEYQISEGGMAMVNHEEALEDYLKHFLMGFSDVLLTRYRESNKIQIS